MVMYQQKALPRWRGFNLTDAVGMDSPGFFRKEDFQMTADLGFNFVRLPVNYRFWAEKDPFDIDERKMAFLDEAVHWGNQYGVHVCLALHRAPGYCVAKNPAEPFDLFADERALEAFCLHWQTLARRYRGISSTRLSFNLVNEPAFVSPEADVRVMGAAADAVHREDPDRLCIADGMQYGNEPSLELAQSCRGYLPQGVTHYQAGWVKQHERFPAPQWPGSPERPDGLMWDAEMLFRHYQAWASLAEIYGIGVICGEGGCYNRTPHDVVLRWMEDWLHALKCANIGYALWNLRGDFGILDSGRADVDYEDYRGHRLDRKMYELMLKY